MTILTNLKRPFVKLLGVGFSITTLTACSMLMPDELKENDKIAEALLSTPGLVEDKTLAVTAPNGNYSLRYVTSDDSDTPRSTLFLVHGTPGDWSSFALYLSDKAFIKDFRVVSIDRPGWGKSGYSGDVFPTKLQDQSKLIGPLLKETWKQNGKQKVIVVGHSLGASLVPLLAADYPQYIRGVVILAGDLDPPLAAGRWYNTLLDWTPNFMLPEMFSNSNMEVLDLTQSLEEAQSAFKGITVPITILQGTEDTLVNPKSATFAKTLFTNSDLDVQWIKGAGHIINLQHPDLVKKVIREMDQRSAP